MYEKLLEDHPHLVTHYGVAFSSEHKKVNIFMDLCGMFFSCCLSLSVDYNAMQCNDKMVVIAILFCLLFS